VRTAGSGKTTFAKALESRLHAVRFAPDEWMDALSLDIYDEERRGKIEALQWKFAKELLALGLTVIIEWGTWGGPSGIPCGSEPEPLVLPLSCIMSLRQQMCSLRGFNAEVWRSRP